MVQPEDVCYGEDSPPTPSHRAVSVLSVDPGMATET